MASDEPLPDRCGATVTDKVGLEIHDDEIDQSFYSEEDLEDVVLEKGAVTTHKEPEYAEVIPHLRKGFDTIAVNLSRSDGDDGDDLERVAIEDDDPYVTNAGTELQGYCERYPMTDRERCYVHKGNENGAGEGNTNAMTHGLKAKRSNFYKNMSEEDKVFVEAMADSWIDNAPFDRENFAKVNEVYRIAVDQCRLWNAQDHFDDGMVYEQVVGVNDQGDPIEVEDENPVNLPYDRLDRTTIRKLKELGCLSDPESQKAESMDSLAQKFAEIESD